MFSGLRGWEPVIILVVVLLLFGARRLPDLARSIGTSAREFRKGLRDDEKADDADPGDGDPQGRDAEPDDARGGTPDRPPGTPS